MMAIIHCDNGCSVNHVHTLFFVKKIGFQQEAHSEQLKIVWQISPISPFLNKMKYFPFWTEDFVQIELREIQEE